MGWFDDKIISSVQATDGFEKVLHTQRCPGPRSNGHADPQIAHQYLHSMNDVPARDA